MRRYFETMKKIDGFFEKRWFILPVVSALLLILSFYPFNLWFLNLVAFAPFFYFINLQIPRRKLFWGGFLFGAVFSFSLNYFTVIQFHWLPETYLFKSIINLSFIPLSLIGALVAGLIAVLYKTLRSRNLVFNVFIFAAVSVAAELFLNFIFGGYFLGMLPLTADTFQPMIRLASVGGMFFVSFLMYSANGFLGQLLLIREMSQAKSLVKGLAASFVFIALLFIGNEMYLAPPANGDAQTAKVAVLQNADRGEGAFATTTDESFRFNKLEELLKEASAEKPDLIIYPFSPVVGAFYFTPPIAEFNKKILVTGTDKFAKWLNGIVPEETAVMTWDVIYDGGGFFNQNDFWLDGRLVGSYRKRNLFPFADYTPKWAQNMSFYTTPFDIVRGEGNQFVSLPGGLSFGNLICSEISSQALALADARKSQIIISAGSEAMFADSVASAFNLMHARYRAAENNIPVIRANRFGPSAIIAPDGSLVSKMNRGEDGVMTGEIEIKERQMTLFNTFGNVIIIFLIISILFLAIYLRNKKSAV